MREVEAESSTSRIMKSFSKCVSVQVRPIPQAKNEKQLLFLRSASFAFCQASSQPSDHNTAEHGVPNEGTRCAYLHVVRV